MKHWWHLLLLLPPAISIGCFQAAMAWMRHVGTNRSETDHILAYVGLVMFGFAVLAAIWGSIIVCRHDERRYWPWLVVHVAAVAAVIYFAGDWFGHHLA
jgi:hypothetical protein